MLLSISLILLLGLALSWICKLLHLPSLIGYLAVGIILSALHLVDEGILNISSELKKIALVFILIRAGMSLNINDLKKIGRPAIFMTFVPAVFEMTAVGLIAPLFFDISYLDAFIMGSVLGAVSPAVVVPRMLDMIDNGLGIKNGVPQLIIAGSSIDDVVVIVVFTALTTMATGGTIGVMTYLNVPISIILGIASGIVIGIVLVWFFKKVHIRDTIKVIIISGICFGLVALESILDGIIGYSGLIATITIGMVILSKYQILADRLSKKYSKLWVVAEILLFVLVGATLDINYFINNLGFGILLILCGLAVRGLGVVVSLIKTKFTKKEKLFCVIAYSPKATVQAAIGGIPLAMGIASGNLILSVAVISILLTAPLGAFLIDLTVKKLNT